MNRKNISNIMNENMYSEQYGNFSPSDFSITAEELRQYFYCPKIIYYRKVRKIIPAMPYTVKKGAGIHNMIAEKPGMPIRFIKSRLKEIGLSAYRYVEPGVVFVQKNDVSESLNEYSNQNENFTGINIYISISDSVEEDELIPSLNSNDNNLSDKKNRGYPVNGRYKESFRNSINGFFTYMFNPVLHSKHLGLIAALDLFLIFFTNKPGKYDGIYFNKDFTGENSSLKKDSYNSGKVGQINKTSGHMWEKAIIEEIIPIEIKTTDLDLLIKFIGPNNIVNDVFRSDLINNPLNELISSLTSNNLFNQNIKVHHLVQLTAHALLLEEYFNTAVFHGAILYIDEMKLNRRLLVLHDISIDMKRVIIEAIDEIREICMTEIPPEVQFIPEKCADCEYWKWCKGV